MKEKDFNVHFNKFLINRFKGSGAFELKLTKTNSLPFDSVKEHQLHALQTAKYKSLVFKIPDLGLQNPCDVLKLENVPAFVVVMYYKRGQKEFIMLDIDVFLTEMHTSERKSLTEERAKEIGEVHKLGE